MFDRIPFSELLGQTIDMVLFEAIDSVVFDMSDGKRYCMYHDCSCCEKVYLEDVIGDVEDIVGSPLLQAEEVSNEPHPDKPSDPEMYEQSSSTWTFYKLATNKGRVTLRWFGTSNGSYSEEVELYRIK